MSQQCLPFSRNRKRKANEESVPVDFSNVDIQSIDASTIYDVPNLMLDEGLDKVVLEHLDLPVKQEPSGSSWTSKLLLSGLLGLVILLAAFGISQANRIPTAETLLSEIDEQPKQPQKRIRQINTFLTHNIQCLGHIIHTPSNKKLSKLKPNLNSNLHKASYH